MDLNTLLSNKKYTPRKISFSFMPYYLLFILVKSDLMLPADGAPSTVTN